MDLDTLGWKLIGMKRRGVWVNSRYYDLIGIISVTHSVGALTDFP